MNGKNAMELANYILKKVTKGLEHISKIESEHIYAYSFLYTYEDDETENWPILIFGYNTAEHYKREIAKRCDGQNVRSLIGFLSSIDEQDAESIFDSLKPDEQDVKWNYNYWLQNSILEVGTHDDAVGRDLVKNWTMELGLHFTEDELTESMDACLEKGREIRKHFTRILTWVVLQIHEQLAPGIPFIIHDYEYNGQAAVTNLEANGLKLSEAFVTWINQKWNQA